MYYSYIEPVQLCLVGSEAKDFKYLWVLFRSDGKMDLQNRTAAPSHLKEPLELTPEPAGATTAQLVC